MKITKTYVMKWKAKLESQSPYHNEYWFYDERWEFVGWCVEYKSIFKTEKTNLWLPWLENNFLLYSKDWFMRLNEIREEFYKCLQVYEYRVFFIKQHRYLDY